MPGNYMKLKSRSHQEQAEAKADKLARKMEAEGVLLCSIPQDISLDIGRQGQATSYSDNAESDSQVYQHRL
jgi:hypothetical protein